MKTVRLGDVAEVNPRVTAELKAQSDQEIAFLPMDAVSEDGTVRYQERRLASSVLTGYTLFKKGDVLLAKITPCMENGKAAYLDDLATEFGAGSTEFHVLRPGPSLDGRFLFYLIWNPAFRAKAERRMTGSAGQKRVPADFLKDLSFKCPPLDEQRRIAAILDKADAIRRKRQQALALADDFLRSAFLEMFGDPVTNPKGWTVVPLGDVLNGIDSGFSPKCQDRPANDDEWGVLKLSAVTSTEFDPTQNKAIIKLDDVDHRHEVRKGDLLFTRKNTYELVGASALIGDCRKRLLMPDLIFRLVTNNKVDRRFLWAQLTLPTMRKLIQRLASGAAGSMPNISKSRLVELPLLLPAMAYQMQFADLYERTVSLKSFTEHGQHTGDALFASLSQRAFRGEL